MKFFEYKKIGHKIKWNIFGIKVTFHLPPKKNHYISLGGNCFVRMVLTLEKMKAYRKSGELSCPFDLCHTPLASLVDILENNFTDYLEDIDYDTENSKYFINRKYSILYTHEDNLTLDEVKIRYKKRIENFRRIAQENDKKKYILSFEQNKFTVEQLNNIYNSLLKLRNGKPFKFYVLNFIHNNPPTVDLTELNPKIEYIEADITNELEENKGTWEFKFRILKINPEILNRLAK